MSLPSLIKCIQTILYSKNLPLEERKIQSKKDVIYVNLVSLLLTLNRFQSLFWCFHC